MFYSVLVAEGAAVNRYDYSKEAWDEPPENAVGWWKSQMPEPNANKINWAPNDVMVHYFEQLGEDRLRITLAVAGFSNDELSVQVEDNQLIVRGKQIDDKDRVYLHRGIAARQFQRSFVLADGLEVSGATLDSGLLDIELKRPIPAARVKTIAIRKNSGKKARTLDVSPERGDD